MAFYSDEPTFRCYRRSGGLASVLVPRDGGGAAVRGAEVGVGAAAVLRADEGARAAQLRGAVRVLGDAASGHAADGVTDEALVRRKGMR